MADEQIAENLTALDVEAGLAPAHRGRVTVAQRVLDAIAQLTTLNVPGVARLSARSGLRRGADGVRVDVVDDQVVVDVYVIVTHDANMRQIGKEIQVEIARAMNQMVGMDAAAVNVHIQDVEPPPAA